MIQRHIIQTDDAPTAIGTYSQAVHVGNTVYISGQIAMLPTTQELISNKFDEQAHQMFRNIRAVCQAAGGDLNNLVKMTLYLTDLSKFSSINSIMKEYFKAPYPARAAVEVSALPKGAQIEADGIMVL